MPSASPQSHQGRADTAPSRLSHRRARPDDRADRGGDGGVDRRVRGRADRLRHGQGRGQVDGHRRHRARRKARRQERTLPPEMNPAVRTPPAGADYLRIVAILGGLTAMGPLAIDMYLPALPAIARDLHSTPGLVQVSLAAYFIGIAGGQALYGPLSDRMGRKPALYVGLLVFTLSSIACALAPRVEVLIACRFLQALGGCAPLVVPRAVVRDHFDQQASVRALSALVLVMGLAPILAPLVGGQLLTRWGWRAIFVVLAAYGAAWLVIVTLFLPESLPRDARRAQPPAVVLATYRRLLGGRAFIGRVLSGGMMFSGLLAYISGSPFVFIELFGVPPERFGFYFGANAAGLITASQVNAWLARRHGARRLVSAVIPCAAAAGVVLMVAAGTGI